MKSSMRCAASTAASTSSFPHLPAERQVQLKDQLISKIENRTACIGIVGLGYVGLPLALEFAKAGFKVIGYDVSERVVNGLMSGKSHIQDVSNEEVSRLGEAGKVRGAAG